MFFQVKIEIENNEIETCDLLSDNEDSDHRIEPSRKIKVSFMTN